MLPCASRQAWKTVSKLPTRAIAKVISEHLPDTEATAEVTAASVDNLKFLRDGKADIAFTLADTLADAIKGLLSISQAGAISVLTTQADGLAFQCTNDLDVAADGTIYFTDATSKFPLTMLKAEILEHRPNGRFLAYDPRSKQTRTILKDLYFANGVALSTDQSFALVCDTETYSIKRVWLTGTKQGQSETFIDNLPGFPDGISSNGRDTFWLALVNRRDSVLDRLMPHPFLRKAVYRLPELLQPDIRPYAFVLALDSNGKVIRNLQDPSPGCFTQIANVVEHNGSLYFGSIRESSIGRFPLTVAR